MRRVISASQFGGLAVAVFTAALYASYAAFLVSSFGNVPSGNGISPVMGLAICCTTTSTMDCLAVAPLETVYRYLMTPRSPKWKPERIAGSILVEGTKIVCDSAVELGSPR